MYQTLFLADIWCALVSAMECFWCLFTISDVRPGHLANKSALVALIQVVGTGFHIDW